MNLDLYYTSFEVNVGKLVNEGLIEYVHSYNLLHIHRPFEEIIGQV